MRFHVQGASASTGAGPVRVGRGIVRGCGVAAVFLLLGACQDLRDPIGPQGVEIGRASLGIQSSSALADLVPAGVAYRDPTSGWVRISGPPTSGVGAAWLGTRTDLANGFTGAFTYRIAAGDGSTDEAVDGDGFAFLVQDEGPDVTGGGQLGYNDLGGSPSLNRSVAVEFDTFVNSNEVRSSGTNFCGGVELVSRRATPHISVQPRGRWKLEDSLGCVQEELSGTRSVVVRYDPGAEPSEGVLRVWIANGTDSPDTGETPALRVTGFDLAAHLGGTSGYLGFTAQSGGNNPQAHDILAFSLELPSARYEIEVTVDLESSGATLSTARFSTTSSSTPCRQGITVIATNVETGEHFPLVTQDCTGTVLFSLPAGNYIFSAYRLKVPDVNQLVIWPSEFGGDDGDIEGAYLPAIWDNAAGQSKKRTVSNLLGVLGSGAIDVTNGPGSIGLTMALGATLNCTFLDENGNPLTGFEDTKVFGIVPVDEPDEKLPKRFVPSGFDSRDEGYLNGLRRGSGFGISSLSNCSFPGTPEGTIFIESEPVELDGEYKVYRASRVVGGSGTFTTTAGPTPLMIKKSHTNEEIGDAVGPQDFGGAIVYGWNVPVFVPDSPNGDQDPGNTFIVTSQFRGNGHYTVELAKGPSFPGTGTPITVTALCENKGCKLHSSSGLPRGVRVDVEGTSARNVNGFEAGSLEWRITLPTSGTGAWRISDSPGSVDEFQITFRIRAGQSASSPSDVLNGGGVQFLTSTRKRDPASTWLLAGVM
jgi:hypothetical protein